MEVLSDVEIREISKKVGHPRGLGHGKKPVDIEKMRQMLSTGFSKPQIGAYFDVSEATISRRFRNEVREAKDAEREAEYAERTARREAEHAARQAKWEAEHAARQARYTAPGQ